MVAWKSRTSHHVLLGVVAEFVGVAVRDSAFDSSARHPDGKAFDVVVASIALRHGGASEFSAPDYEGVVEHASLFEVLNECRRALVDALCDSGDGVLDPAVVIPAAVVKVYETHAPLGQSSGEYAVAGEGSVSGLGSVEVKDVLGFVGDVHQFGNAGLHAEGHLVLAYLGGDLGITQGHRCGRG